MRESFAGKMRVWGVGKYVTSRLDCIRLTAICHIPISYVPSSMRLNTLCLIPDQQAKWRLNFSFPAYYIFNSLYLWLTTCLRNCSPNCTQLHGARPRALKLCWRLMRDLPVEGHRGYCRGDIFSHLSTLYNYYYYSDLTYFFSPS